MLGKYVHNKNTVNVCSGRVYLSIIDLPCRQSFSVIMFLRKRRGEGEVAVCFLCIFLYGAGLTDIFSGKVRNWWLLAGAVIGLWLKGMSFLVSAFTVLIPAYLLFRVRMLGAGDGKLMALISGYLGMEAGIYAIGSGMAIGAMWSLCRIRHDRSLLSRFIFLDAWFRQTILTKEFIPYERVSYEKKSKKELKAQEQCSICGQLSVESRHTIPLAACLAVGTYLYLLVSCVLAVRKGIL